MPQNFLTCDRDQRLLLPPDLRDWLPDDHLAWFVIEGVEELDLDAFYGACRAELFSHRSAMVEPVFGDRPLGMATDRGHPQPPEAPPTHDGGRNGLSPGGMALPFSVRADCGAGLPLRRAFV